MKSLREIKVDDVRKWDLDNVKDAIEYFEDGCLCIHSGKLPVKIGVNAFEFFTNYMTGCVCSRHPEGEKK